MSIISIRSGSIKPISETKTSSGSDKSHTIVSVSQQVDKIDGVSSHRIQRTILRHDHLLLQLNFKRDCKAIKTNVFFTVHGINTYIIWYKNCNPSTNPIEFNSGKNTSNLQKHNHSSRTLVHNDSLQLKDIHIFHIHYL